MNSNDKWSAKLLNMVFELMPTCRDASRLQSHMLEETLPLRTRFGLRCHLLLCVWCRRYGRQLQVLRETLRQDGERLADAPPLNPSSDFRSQIKKALREGVS
jgi:hypothetical protein